MLKSRNEVPPFSSLRSLCAVTVLATVACSTDAPDTSPAGDWVGTITTGGNVTTVINESGSVWGGEVGLEETLSIGAEVGDEPYLLGQVGAVGATTERIYVLDRQLSVVRVYDMSGTHVIDIGRGGKVPGSSIGRGRWG